MRDVCVRLALVAGLIAAGLVGAGVVGAADSIRVTASGDFGTTADTSAVLTTIRDRDPDAHIALGDLSYDTNPETAWCSYVKQRLGEGFPFELLAGNHEMAGLNGDINDFGACLPNQVPGVTGTYGREYFYDLPAPTPLARVINLSAGLAFPEATWAYAVGDAHYTWVVNAIDSARAAGIPFVVVTNHYPCLSIGVYSCPMPRSLFDLLLAKRVDLVLLGHEHAYMRTHQLRTGGTACPTLVPGTFTSGCVSDSDGRFTSGSGTVFATVGTSGIAQRDLNLGDSELGYFAAYAGLNRDRTFGVLELNVTSSELRADFVRATGGTFQDGFTIEKATGNAAPIADFTVGMTGLSAQVDAAASHDPDGASLTYAWNFGDGATDTGVRPNPHAYAAPGTYTISLTVTDIAGSSASTTRTAVATGGTQQVELQPVADTYSHQLNPTSNYGTSGSLAVYGSPDVTAFLRFTLPSAPAGTSLVGATLRVTPTTLGSAATTNVVQIRLGTDGWSESTLTHQNRPAIGTTSLGSWPGLAGSGAQSAAVDPAPLRPLLGGPVTLNLVGTGTDSAWINSRTASTTVRPVLTLTFG